MKQPLLALLTAILVHQAHADTNTVPPIIQVPWVNDPVNATNYARTNLPAWWDDGGYHSDGVKLWQMTQALMENLRRITNALALLGQSNVATGIAEALSNAAPSYISTGGAASFATLAVWSGPSFTLDTNGNLVARSAVIGNGGTEIIELNADGSVGFANSQAVIETSGNVRATSFSGINNGPAIFSNGITISAPMTFPATNSPSPGDALRWDGTHFYWGP